MIIDAISGVGSGSGTQIVQKPTVVVGTYTYDGTAQGPTITGLDTQNTIVTNATATNAGTYTLTIALKNSAKMVWNDMTTADLVYTYTISKATLTVPTVTDTTKTYNGSAQSPTITGFDSTTMTKTGDSATDAGNYTITFGLIDSTNYEWNTTNTVNWSIAKADQTITLSSNSVTLDSEHLTATVTVSGAQGAISVTSSASSVATASVSGSTITISNVNETTGSATITVSVAGTTNYNPATDSTISVSAQFADFLTDWLTAANLNPASYADLDAVLADESAVRKLFTIHDAVDVIVDEVSTIESTDLTKIFNDNYVAKWVNLRDYALDTLYANSTIAGYMDTADKYFYGEWALMPQVPPMTSATTPYGEVISYGMTTYAQRAPYKAFNGDNAASGTENFTESTSSTSWLGYAFNEPINIKIATLYQAVGTSTIDQYLTAGKIQYSDDLNTWEDAGSFSGKTASDWMNGFSVSLDSENSHRYWRLQAVSVSTNAWGIKALQFYAWSPKGNVPVMTSDTAPYGEASADSISGGESAFRAFNPSYNAWCSNGASSQSSSSWLTYKFTNPVKALSCKVQLMNKARGDVPVDCIYKIQGSNDGFVNEIDNLTDNITVLAANAYDVDDISLTTQKYYLYYRILFVQRNSSYGGSYFGVVSTLQFYGREMKVSVPIMTSNTTPYGEAFAKDYYTSGYEAWHAFDGNNGGGSGQKWNSKTLSADNYLGYKFTDRIVIKKVWFLPTYDGGPRQQVKEFKIQGSNDGTTWIDLSPVITLNDQAYDEGYSVNLNNSTEYQYYRIYLISSYITNNYSINELQFYGFDYSEYDWDSVKPRHYIYDHGLELETLTDLVVGTDSRVSKNPDDIEFYVPGSAQVMADAYCTIDLTSYNLMRGVVGDKMDHNVMLSVWSQTPNYTNTGRDASQNPIASGLMPYNMVLDISSINGSKIVSLHNHNNTGTTSGGGSYTEWWLE